ncbi:hypothetical protein KAR10_06790, partial [bacterium]|nr:hypothetical protein [bacterium]
PLLKRLCDHKASIPMQASGGYAGLRGIGGQKLEEEGHKLLSRDEMLEKFEEGMALDKTVRIKSEINLIDYDRDRTETLNLIEAEYELKNNPFLNDKLFAIDISSNGKIEAIYYADPVQEGSTEYNLSTMGTGRTVRQSVLTIEDQILDGSLFKSLAVQNAIRMAKLRGYAHFSGLLQEMSVHASSRHLYYMIQHFQDQGIDKFMFDMASDGRDESSQYAIERVRQLKQALDYFGITDYEINIRGREQCFDRGNNWPITEGFLNELMYGSKRKIDTEVFKAKVESQKITGLLGSLIPKSILDSKWLKGSKGIQAAPANQLMDFKTMEAEILRDVGPNERYFIPLNRIFKRFPGLQLKMISLGRVFLPWFTPDKITGADDKELVEKINAHSKDIKKILGRILLDNSGDLKFTEEIEIGLDVFPTGRFKLETKKGENTKILMPKHLLWLLVDLIEAKTAAGKWSISRLKNQLAINMIQYYWNQYQLSLLDKEKYKEWMSRAQRMEDKIPGIRSWSKLGLENLTPAPIAIDENENAFMPAGQIVNLCIQKSLGKMSDSKHQELKAHLEALIQHQLNSGSDLNIKEGLLATLTRVAANDNNVLKILGVFEPSIAKLKPAMQEIETANMISSLLNILSGDAIEAPGKEDAAVETQLSRTYTMNAIPKESRKIMREEALQDVEDELALALLHALDKSKGKDITDTITLDGRYGAVLEREIQRMSAGTYQKSLAMGESRKNGKIFAALLGYKNIALKLNGKKVSVSKPMLADLNTKDENITNKEIDKSIPEYLHTGVIKGVRVEVFNRLPAEPGEVVETGDFAQWRAEVLNWMSRRKIFPERVQKQYQARANLSALDTSLQSIIIELRDKLKYSNFGILMKFNRMDDNEPLEFINSSHPMARALRQLANADTSKKRTRAQAVFAKRLYNLMYPDQVGDKELAAIKPDQQARNLLIFSRLVREFCEDWTDLGTIDTSSELWSGLEKDIENITGDLTIAAPKSLITELGFKHVLGALVDTMEKLDIVVNYHKIKMFLRKNLRQSTKVAA